LIPIWERILQRAPISPTENFFAVGGDAARAIELVVAIEDALDRDLPITAIHDAPTIGELAGMLSASPAVKVSPLPLIKSGNGRSAVFLAPGMRSDERVMNDFAALIQSNNPVYGISTKGLGRNSLRHWRIEDLARYYSIRISRAGFSGPHHLVGYSFGGLICLELAGQLRACGEQVGVLALLDTFPFPNYWPLRCRLEVFVRRAIHHLRAAKSVPIGEAAAYIAERLRRIWRGQSPSSVALMKPGWRTFEANNAAEFAAMARYRPRRYGGKLTFFRCAVDTIFPSNPRTVWGALADQIDVHSLACEHHQMFTTHIDIVAAELSRCLGAYNDCAA
jgi:thioesterase domain-containing protein/acyl carrier protein